MELHCPEYEHLTMEEKLLVDITMRKWFMRYLLNRRECGGSCIPPFIFKIAESRIIERLKENDKRD